jgi:hypothetical protein
MKKILLLAMIAISIVCAKKMEKPVWIKFSKDFYLKQDSYILDGSISTVETKIFVKKKAVYGKIIVDCMYNSMEICVYTTSLECNTYNPIDETLILFRNAACAEYDEIEANAETQELP